MTVQERMIRKKLSSRFDGKKSKKSYYLEIPTVSENSFFFNSRFECGNLAEVRLLEDGSYDAYLEKD